MGAEQQRTEAADDAPEHHEAQQSAVAEREASSPAVPPEARVDHVRNAAEGVGGELRSELFRRRVRAVAQRSAERLRLDPPHPPTPQTDLQELGVLIDPLRDTHEIQRLLTRLVNQKAQLVQGNVELVDAVLVLYIGLDAVPRGARRGDGER